MKKPSEVSYASGGFNFLLDGRHRRNKQPKVNYDERNKK